MDKKEKRNEIFGLKFDYTAFRSNKYSKCENSRCGNGNIFIEVNAYKICKRELKWKRSMQLVGYTRCHLSFVLNVHAQHRHSTYINNSHQTIQRNNNETTTKKCHSFFFSFFSFFSSFVFIREFVIRIVCTVHYYYYSLYSIRFDVTILHVQPIHIRRRRRRRTESHFTVHSA